MLRGQSLFLVLYGIYSKYDYFRVFGYYCYPYLRPYNKNKLEFRFFPCTFLGYSTQHKGYQCLNPERLLVDSQHVVFDEGKFLSASPDVAQNSTDKCVTTCVPIVSTPCVSSVPTSTKLPNMVSAPSMPTSVPSSMGWVSLPLRTPMIEDDAMAEL